MNTKVYILMYRSFTGKKLIDCKVHSVHATKESAILMLEALKYGHLHNFNDVKTDKKNEFKIYITSDTMQAEYEIEIHKYI